MKSSVLIAGLGSIGQRHLRNLLQLGIEDVALLRTSSQPLDFAAHLPVYTDLDQALSTAPDLVMVTNPTANHLQVALPAAKSGCHLFIEKPLSHTWDGVADLLDIVREQNLLTLVGFDLRFDPGLGLVKSLLDANQIGRLVSIQAQVGQYLPDWHPWEDYRQSVSARRATGGGVILDLIHELDYVSWLMGPVTAITCFADRVSSLEIETEDVACMLLEFESGTIGTIHLDYIQRVASRTCRIIGEGGTILWDYFARKVSWYESDAEEWQSFEYDDFERNDRFSMEMEHLLRCLSGDEQPCVDVVSGSKTLELAIAAKAAAKTGNICRFK